jgi:hypothetical protein
LLAGREFKTSFDKKISANWIQTQPLENTTYTFYDNVNTLSIKLFFKNGILNRFPPESKILIGQRVP